MTGISDRDVRRLDLNLLKALTVLVEEHSVTHAASRLCVTQSAASNMLSRLRRALGDPILVRVGNAMVPTEPATRLANALAQHFEAIASAMAGLSRFNPLEADRRFRVGMPDYLAQVLLPAISRLFAAQAPEAQLVVRHASAEDFELLLDDGDADAVISMIRSCRPHHRSQLVVEERYTCLYDPDSPLVDPLTMAAYTGRPHVFVSFSGDLDGPVDAALRRKGQERRVVVATPSFAPISSLLKGTPLLATVPGPFGRYCEKSFGLRTTALPFDLDPIPVSLIWHRRADADLSVKWFRDLLTSAIEEVGL